MFTYSYEDPRNFFISESHRSSRNLRCYWLFLPVKTKCMVFAEFCQVCTIIASRNCCINAYKILSISTWRAIASEWMPRTYVSCEGFGRLQQIQSSPGLRFDTATRSTHPNVVSLHYLKISNSLFLDISSSLEVARLEITVNCFGHCNFQ